MISNRNIDSNREYVLLQRNVEAKAKLRNDDALERAVDEATEEFNGEYLMNVKVYIKRNGKRIKVIGDVYGEKKTEINIESSVTASIELKIGDLVSFKSGEKIKEGRIIGLNQSEAIVEFKNFLGQSRRISLKFDELIKLEN